MAFDGTDRAILRSLLRNGRTSYRELAERTGITPPTVKSRVDAMVEQGVIEGFTVELNEAKLTEESVMDALVLIDTKAAATDDVYEVLKTCEGAVTVTRTADSTVAVRFKGSRDTFDKHIINKMPNGVTGYRTMLVTEEEKKEPAL